MTAICKVISVHGKPANTIGYISDRNKTDIDRAIDNSESDYMRAFDPSVKDPLMARMGITDTQNEILVSGVNCDPATASISFDQVRDRYRAGHSEGFYTFDYNDPKLGKIRTATREPIEALHVIQSFSETDIDPRAVHELGIELANRIGAEFGNGTDGQNINLQAVVSTHMNKEHMHNHLAICAYKIDGSGKYTHNAVMVNRIREISDELQHEYGITVNLLPPREQLRQSHLIPQGKCYGEWQYCKNSESWKDAIRADMTELASISADRYSFIANMQAYGYRLDADHGDSITWYVPAADRKIRDTTLGADFAISAIYPTPEQNLEKTNQSKLITVHTDNNRTDQISAAPYIDINRYDTSGNRRGDLELALRRVIAFLQRIQNQMDCNGQTRQAKGMQDKINLVANAIKVAKVYHIDSADRLEWQINNIRSPMRLTQDDLKIAQSNKSYNDTIVRLYNQIKTVSDKLDLSDINMYLSTPAKLDIRTTLAHDYPVDYNTKRALYCALRDNPDTHLLYPVRELNQMVAVSIVNYLNRGTPLSDMARGYLAEGPDYDRITCKIKADKDWETLKNIKRAKLQDSPLSDRQTRALDKILKANGHGDIDVSKLTAYDNWQIRCILSPNPFDPAVGLIDTARAAQIAQSAAAKGLTLRRPATTIMVNEVKQIADYIVRVHTPQEPSYAPAIFRSQITPTKPDLSDLDKHNPDDVPEIVRRQMAAEKRKKIEKHLLALMDDKKVMSAIPVKQMTDADIYSMTDYLTVKDRIPDCFVPAPLSKEVRDQAFYDSIADRTPQEQIYLTRVRSAMQQLSDMGITPSQIEITYKKTKDLIAIYHNQINHNLEDREALKSLYQLKHTSHLCDNFFGFAEQEIQEQEKDLKRENPEQDYDNYTTLTPEPEVPMPEPETEELEYNYNDFDLDR